MCPSVVCTGHRPVPLLSGSIPNLDFDCLVINYNGFGGELDSNGGFGLEVELVFSEFADDVGLAYPRVSNEDNFVMVVTRISFFTHLVWLIYLVFYKVSMYYFHQDWWIIYTIV